MTRGPRPRSRRQRLQGIGITAAIPLLLVTATLSGQDPRTFFRQNCANCHTIGGGRLTGPDLKGVTERRDRQRPELVSGQLGEARGGAGERALVHGERDRRAGAAEPDQRVQARPRHRVGGQPLPGAEPGRLVDGAGQTEALGLGERGGELLGRRGVLGALDARLDGAAREPVDLGAQRGALVPRGADIHEPIEPRPGRFAYCSAGPSIDNSGR